MVWKHRLRFALVILAGLVALSGAARAEDVMIFWHQNGLVESEAMALKRKLQKLGIDAVVSEHGDERAPDAIYIRPDADAEAVRTILSTLTYTPSYIFPVDYPNDEVGVDSEFSISVGLRSTHRYYEDEPAEVPYRVTAGSLAYLSEAGISQQEFARRLNHIAPSRVKGER